MLESFRETIIKHEKWLLDLGMVPNKSKTEAVHFGSITEKVIEIDGVDVKVGKHMKMLGIWVDSLLRWDLHVDKTVKKCRSLSYAMRFLNRFLNIKEMRTVFLSHFVGRLMYGSPVWFLAYL